MIDLSIWGLKYARFILEKPDISLLERLKKEYSHIFILADHELKLEGFALTKKKTPMVYLSKELDEIFRNFNETTRNEIRRTEKISDLSFKISDNNLGSSYRLYKKIKRADGVTVDLKREFKDCLFFNGYYRGKLFVSVACWDNGQILRLKSIVSVRKEPNFDYHLVSYATRRLIWEICKYGKQKGYRAVDLGGINFDEEAKKGLAQFKSSFGGDIIDIYIYRYETSAFKFLRKILSLFYYQFT